MYQLTGSLMKKHWLWGEKVAKADCVLFTSATADDLSEAVRQAVVAGVELVNVDMNGLSLPGAYLRDARLRGRLHKANLAGANLSGAVLGDLTDANLSGANLSGARVGWLQGADLTGADLSGVNLVKKTKGAKVDRADVRGTTVDTWDLCVTSFMQCRNLGDLIVTKEHRPVSVTGNVEQMLGLEGQNWRAILRAQGKPLS